ncbi:MAG: sugar ABC transporter permease [Acholeplasmataceae bacterium]|nr:sugar ABC transporter permease [Acholeplasmataceae bacterium]
MKKMTLKTKRAIVGLLFVSPALVGLLTFIMYPLIRTIYFSFNTVQYSVQFGYLYQWVGFGNYQRILFEDIDFVFAAQDFLLSMFIDVPAIISLSVIIAMLLNSKIKGTTFFRIIFFLPIIILNGEFMNNMVKYGSLSITSSGFIYNAIIKLAPEFIVGVIIGLFDKIMQILWFSAVPILIFLSALQKIDGSIKEAAAIDGASRWQFFWKVTLPTIFPFVGITIIYIVVFLGNWDLNPINQIIKLAQNDGSRREGYASALAILYALLQTFIIGTLFFITRNKEKVRRK